MAVEKPTKCVSSRKLIEINAQIQFIDFEGRSDGESMLKILSQLRPRRVIVVRGLQQSAETVARHCQQNIGARVFTPQKGEVNYCEWKNCFTQPTANVAIHVLYILVFRLSTQQLKRISIKYDWLRTSSRSCSFSARKMLKWRGLMPWSVSVVKTSKQTIQTPI